MRFFAKGRRGKGPSQTANEGGMKSADTVDRPREPAARPSAVFRFAECRQSQNFIELPPFSISLIFLGRRRFSHISRKISSGRLCEAKSSGAILFLILPDPRRQGDGGGDFKGRGQEIKPRCLPLLHAPRGDVPAVILLGGRGKIVSPEETQDLKSRFLQSAGQLLP